MLFGRLADLHAPQPIFCVAFAVIGVMNLSLSFLTDRYGFLILRVFTGIAAAAVVPSSYRLIPMIFQPNQKIDGFHLVHDDWINEQLPRCHHRWRFRVDPPNKTDEWLEVVL